MSTPQPDTTGVSVWRRASTFERGIYSNLYRWLAAGRISEHLAPWRSVT